MEYTKRIYDSVHGFIYLSSLERDFIDSYAFGRLHDLKQQGVAYLVYPGATNTRFEHSLGVMHIASQMYDQLIRTYSQALEESFSLYWKQIVRFAGLCHDLGHLPFSHTAESRLLGKEGHESWTLKVIESDFLAPLWQRLAAQYPNQSVKEDVAKVALGEAKLTQLRPGTLFSSWERLLSEVITGDFFGADRIDYLLRDSKATGISYGLFDYQQLIEMLRILPSAKVEEEGTLTLGIEENGLASTEALLIARHFMHRRVYQYPSVKAYSFHMARFMQWFSHSHPMLRSLEDYLFFTDSQVLSALREVYLDKKSPAQDDAKALIDKSCRYLAVELQGLVAKEDLLDLCSGLDKEKLYVEPHEDVAPFSFPVLYKGGRIKEAKNVFSLSVPPRVSTWVYVPQDQAPLIDFLREQYAEMSHAKN